MNRACKVTAHGAGLFSNINKILVCLRLYEQVYVDWSKAGPNDPAFKYGGSFYGDCWHDLFYDATSPPSEPYDTVHQYPFYDITGACAGIMYQNPEWNWRETYHKAWARLTCVVEPIPVGPNTIGVMIRSDALGGEQLYGKSQPLEQYADAIAKVHKAGTSLFVVSSDNESISWLLQRYPGLYFSSGIKRSAHRSDPEQHLHVPQTKMDAIDVMREVLTLARCDSLIHPISNMATAALIINPQLKSIYLK